MMMMAGAGAGAQGKVKKCITYIAYIYSPCTHEMNAPSLHDLFEFDKIVLGISAKPKNNTIIHTHTHYVIYIPSPHDRRYIQIFRSTSTNR